MFRRPFQSALIAWLVLASGMEPMAAAETKPGAGAEQRFHVTHWTAEDGLPQNSISALAQTPDGYLWVGTWFGLARFDGVRFVVFNRANTPEFRRESVTALAVDRADGALWIGTREGVLRLKDGQFIRPTGTDGLSQWDISRLTASADGGVWVHAGGRIVFHGGVPSSVARIDFIEGEHFQTEWETEDRRLALATSGRFFQVAKDGAVSGGSLPTGTPTNLWVAGLLPTDRAGHKWFSDGRHLFRFADGQWKELQAFLLWERQVRFLTDRAGGVWAACGQAGLWRHSEAGAQLIQLNERGAEKTIGHLLEDFEGHIWAGGKHGLFQLRPTLIEAVTRENGLPADNCWSVCEAQDGAIWVETERGVARIQNGRAQAFPDEPRRARRMSIRADLSGKLWLGNGHDGLITWRPGAETNSFWSNAEHGAPAGITLGSVYLDRAGRVWVGTDHGATWFENGRLAANWGEFGLPTDNVRSIYQTRDGAMWFGTWNAGAVRWTPHARSGIRNPKSELNQSLLTSAATRFTTADGLADDRVFVFHEDAEGGLWIGTHNGLSRFKDGRFFSFRTEHGLLDNLINWLEEDESGRLWFSCNRGIFRIDRSELNAVAEGRKSRANAAVYGTADGMPSPETNGEHQPAGCKARDGRLWFPTTQGVVVIDPRRVKESEGTEAAPPVIVEEIMADGEVIYGDGLQSPKSERRNLKLSAGRARLLRIRFTANSFSDPRRVRFRYHLSNHDEGWRETVDERLAYYTNLRPGRYRFEVKAATPHGVWSETPATFEFSLAPHYWQTWSFYVLCGVALVGLSGGVVARRLRLQRRILRLDHQRAMEQERARLARDLHDELGTALTGLALEMDVARRGLDEASAMSGRLQGMADNSRAMASRMREVVWAISPRCDNVPGLATFLEQHAAPFARAAGISCRLEFPEVLPALPVAAEMRHQLALGVREALTNVVRHAHSTEVVLSLQVENCAMVLRVADNGVGFCPESVNGGGHGLANLRDRLSPYGGSVKCESTPGRGTVVTFHLPLPTQREFNS